MRFSNLHSAADSFLQNFFLVVVLKVLDIKVFLEDAKDNLQLYM